ncbi:bifunctional 2-polyprenyl-6-hydroxyphenol methylase/3-demethylubiquinol 3-O-methyltransferase UbiG [Synechococcus sp. LTW-R]|uniref:class I SAM-dependent methyltransferase n=1 Tax=Synechococcus sp. LTW-R TaxID=2751170 RepID=UPI001625E465|nr:class I SAM-dependent methyltransferase [Synechococcus sp. LTW-R]QNG30330.1 class I SAM-dependent methyltransferase [Synechococcus sp. LTW-R]
MKSTFRQGFIPPRLKSLTEALAVQCCLNEYVYSTSEEEDHLIALLTSKITESPEEINEYLAVVGCYKPLQLVNLDSAKISHDVLSGAESKDFVATHLTEPFKEKEIKRLMQPSEVINDIVSKSVQEMYEENPYPRYHYSDYTTSTLSKLASEVIRRESTKMRLSFNHELLSLQESPKILIAECGTGDQVIKTSRYKNAKVTAIDLSGRSIAYSIRKTEEYNMTNVSFKRLDILNAEILNETFDLKQCSGVLLHMEKPANGLSALVQQLQPGGYIKLGLYSTAARKTISRAQETIKRLEIESTAKGIRELRSKVMRGEINELIDLPRCVRDFSRCPNAVTCASMSKSIVLQQWN